jgi:hypothetical protein
MFLLSRRFLVGVALRRGAMALLLAIAAGCLLAESPAFGFDPFATHEVTAQFATSAGEPLANAAVRVFAPGDLKTPVETGHTDAQGKFVFDADSDGMWTAEASTGTEVARVMIRVGAGTPQQQTRLPPTLLIGAIILLGVMGWWFLLARGRRRQP